MGEEYIYVAVDETGNLGRSLKGERYYTVVACVVNDRKRFEDATRRLGFDEEVKFQTHEYCREKVLIYAAPAVSKVIFTCYHKGKEPMDRHEQPALHLDMVRTMADDIVSSYGSWSDLVVEVDHKDGVPDRLVREAFENNENRMNDVDCDVLDSRCSYGLQTNDFFVGAIGRMVNQKDMSYVRMFYSEPEQKYFRSSNRRQGEPASATRITGHTVNPSLVDSPPGIAAEFLIPDEARPAVRLDNGTSEGYLKNGRKNLIGSRNRRRQGEPASTQLAEYRPHGQSLTDSPPGIATGLMCLTPGQREVGSPVVRLDNESSEGYLSGGSRSKVRLFEDRRRQGEPASAISVEYRPHGQSITDSPPGIAIQLRTPRAGYPMVRLDGTLESSYLKGRRRSGRLFGSVKRRKE